MAKYSKEREAQHKEYVRLLLIMNPIITILEAKKILEERYSLKLDKDYINKLLNEVALERAKETNILAKTEAFAGFEEESRAAKKFLWEIINDNNSTKAEKISAFREIRSWSSSVLDRKINANVFPQYNEPSYINIENVTDAEIIKKSEELEEEFERLRKEFRSYIPKESPEMEG